MAKRKRDELDDLPAKPNATAPEPNGFRAPRRQYSIPPVEQPANLIDISAETFPESVHLLRSNFLPENCTITHYKKATIADFDVMTNEEGRLARRVEKFELHFIQIEQALAISTTVRILYTLTSQMASIGYTPRSYVEIHTESGFLYALDAPGGGPHPGVPYPSPGIPTKIFDPTLIKAAQRIVFKMGADIVVP